MIQYMPFTYIPEEHADRLIRAVGPLAVWQPQETASSHLHAFAAESRILWRRPVGIDPAQLDQAARSFSQWGELHHGRAGKLNTIYKASEGDVPPEGSVHQIRSQIRRGRDPGATEADSSLFQAALFLCLAHRYDREQDALARELGSVRRLEAQLGKILGEGDDPKASSGPPVMLTGDGVTDPGLFMAERRLQAWARLAASQAEPDGV